ncbi:MAG: MoaD/ThiS family protein [Cocleimonas sp.]
MSIKVLYFASLREEIGRGFDVVEAQEPITINRLWEKATGQSVMPDKLLAAINQEYSDSGGVVNDGDEVAFFPPVTGG